MSTADFVPRPQLAEDVARFVRTRIFNGTYPAGEYIRLDQLAAELGISVTPVREALFELRGEGLLDQLPRRGFVVLPFTDRDISDVSNLQAYVGGELAARAAVNITDDELAVLSSIHDELVAAYAADDSRAVRLNHEFHRAINVAAQSPKLAQLMSQITRYAPESVFPPTIDGWPAKSVADHERILAALTTHDEEQARAAMSDHLAAGAGPLIEHLVKQGVAQRFQTME